MRTFSSHQQKIEYTAFNKINDVKINDLSNTLLKSLTITYGIDDQRRITEFFDADENPTISRYYFDNYEEEVYTDGKTRSIYYISGGNGLSAMYIDDQKENGKTGLYFAHTDYLGSLTGLTDINGNVVQRYAYDPWGNRRDPNNWEVAFNTDGLYQYTARGYTMHEHLEDYGIINMNGRVYDPMLSRFLSPDPQLQAPNMALNYNRYAYAYNNPMLYTDPSGEIVVTLAVIFVTGVLIDYTAQVIQNVAIQNQSNGSVNWGDAFWGE